MRRDRGVLLVMLMACWAAVALAEPAEGVQPGAARPRVALVLSGGGARGFAHVGVLRVLKELRVPVDMVVGVSMGAVVGGAFAAGRTVEQLEGFVRGTNWTGVVADRPARDALAFRRREDDLILPSRIEFGIDGSGIELPPGTAGSAVLETALTRLLPPGTSDRPVDRLPIPFRTAATDLLSGELVDLDDAPLFSAVRASLAVPGVFSPVRVRGRLAVDGGLVRNLPVDLARRMGADVVIAVNVGTPLLREEDMTGGLDVARQMLLILSEQNVQRSLRELGPRDVLISPDLEGVSFLDFTASERAMAAGETAARRAAAALRPYAVSPEAYAAFEHQHQEAAGVRDPGRRLARVEVRSTAHAGSAALTELIGLRAGDVVNAAEVHDATSRLLGRGEFDRVLVDLNDDSGERTLVVQPVESAWARSRVRLGLEVVSDFADDNRFTLTALHTLAWLNPWGAEMRTLARIGSQRSLATQIFQPIAPGSPWFVMPTLEVRASSLETYEQGRRTARLGFTQTSGTLAFGRQLSNWGLVQAGVERRFGRAHVLIPEDPMANSRSVQTVGFAHWRIDTLDTLALPSRGLYVEARVEQGLQAMPDGRRASTIDIVGLQAFRLGDWDSHVSAIGARGIATSAPEGLGGFLVLTGTPRGSIGGDKVVFGRLVMARRIGEMPAGLGAAARLGFSLEAGGAYADAESVRWATMKRAGSVFLSVDTRFGPLFLGAGATRGVDRSVYLFLGPFW